MSRLSLALLLLQGSLFTALAVDVTPTPLSEKENNQTESTGGLPLYQVIKKGGEACILMELDAFVSINWEVSSNETKEIDMILPSSKIETTGSCFEEEAHITLTWKYFRLQWNFSKTRDWKKWFVKQVELQYDKFVLDQKNNSTSGIVMASTRSSSEVLLFSAPLGEAYHCTSEEELDLSSSGSDNAMLRLRRFRLQPFLTKPVFGSSYCPTTMSSETHLYTTTSSDSSDSTITKTANHSPTETSFRTNVVSMNPNLSTFPPPKMTTISRSTDSSTFPAYRSSSHPPNPSAAPLRGSSKVSMPSDETSRNEISPTKPSTFSTSTAAPPMSLPPYIYQKSMPNVLKMSFYPPKKMFFSGIKLDNNDALSAMLWSWYTSGFYTGYYQALQQSKKTY